jgi:hypothetical protein
VSRIKSVSAVVLSLAMLAGNVAVCAGWAATPEARMACCSEMGPCPMHKDDSSGSAAEHVVTQAQADACCASSEQETSNQSNSSPTFIVALSSAVLGTGITVPPSVPSLVLSDGWRTDAPIRVPPVPKHVLLSVFLV